jgi:uncharacterized protein
MRGGLDVTQPRFMDDSNAPTGDLIETFLQRIGGRDAGVVAELFADDVDWYVPGNPALAWVGRRSKRSEIVDYLQTLWSNLVPGESSATIDKIITSNADAAVFGTFTHTAATTGRVFRTPIAFHLTTNAMKIIALQLYEDTWAVSKAYFD